jgi:hypothetical protein
MMDRLHKQSDAELVGNLSGKDSDYKELITDKERIRTDKH